MLRSALCLGVSTPNPRGDIAVTGGRAGLGALWSHQQVAPQDRATVQTAHISPVTSCSLPCATWRLTHEATQFWTQTQVQNHHGHCSTRDALGTAIEGGREETAGGSKKNSFQTKLGRNSPAAVVLHWGRRDLRTSTDPRCPEGAERVLPGPRVEARGAAEHPTRTGRP